MHNNSLTNYLKAQKNLKLTSQSHLLDALSSLMKDEQEALLQDIVSLNLKKLKLQLDLYQDNKQSLQDLHPFDTSSTSGNAQRAEIGLSAAKKGQCGAILIAGGQGTRLGHAGPKGTFPITPIFHKSLFQIFCEKVKKASEKAGRDLPLAVMTSPLNDKLTRNFLDQHDYFGLKKSQVFFFTQTLLPLLNFKGQLFLDDRAQIAKGPDGNGSCFKEFVNQGIYAKWKELGIEYINTILVDNPLADPYDFELFGHLIETKSDLTLKSCKRLSPEEKVGVIVSQDNKPIVVEYHELPEELTFNQEPSANLSLFALTLDFAHQASQLELPLHKASKKSNVFDFEAQKLNYSLGANCWKFETYIFDILPHSSKTTVLTYPREKIFCPLKNKEGDFGPSMVRKSLMKLGIK